MTTALVQADVYPPDKVDLLRRTLCSGFTNDEMELFIAQCVRTGLDPFNRQIHATKRRDRKAGVDKLTIQTGIDGFRLIAARTGDLDGQDGPYWCGADGVWRDVWLDNEPPAAAKVIVFRRGCSRGFVGIARFDEYAQRWPNGDLSGLWPKMPGTMIAKCAEALALRKAFPQDLSGLYTSDEMGQAEEAEPEEERPNRKPKATVPVEAKVIDATPAPAALPAAAVPVSPATADRSADKAPAPKEPDPLTSAAAVTALAHRKGLTWVQLVEQINAKFKTAYTLNRTPWRDFTQAHREHAMDALRKLPDAEPDTTATVERLTGDLAILMGLTPVEVFHRLCGAAGWQDIANYADLDGPRVRMACDSLRAKIAGKAGA